jgi:hypothetical protein
MKYGGAKKCSSRVTNKVVKFMDKAQSKRAKAYMNSGIPKNPFTVLDNFPVSLFVSVSQACGIKMGEIDSSSGEIIDAMHAHEKALAILTEVRERKERELQLEKEKTQQVVVLEGDKVNLDKEIDEEGETSSEESVERAGRHPRVTVRKRRQGRG